MLGGVDDDVDLAADLARKLHDRLRIGEVERHERDLRQGSQLVGAGKLLPGLRLADPDELGPGGGELLDDGAADRALALGHQDLAPARVARHLAQLAVEVDQATDRDEEPNDGEHDSDQSHFMCRATRE